MVRLSTSSTTSSVAASTSSSSESSLSEPSSSVRASSAAPPDVRGDRRREAEVEAEADEAVLLVELRPRRARVAVLLPVMLLSPEAAARGDRQRETELVLEDDDRRRDLVLSRRPRAVVARLRLLPALL